MEKQAIYETVKLANLTKPNEARPHFAKYPELPETLSRFDTKLTLKNMPTRNAAVVIWSREKATVLTKISVQEKVTFCLKRNFICQVVGKPGAEPRISYMTRNNSSPCATTNSSPCAVGLVR